MASKSIFSFLLFLILLSTLLEFSTTRAAPSPYKGLLDKISTALSEKGYHAMSRALRPILLSALIPISPVLSFTNTSFITIFCPPNKAFQVLSLRYSEPPLGLLLHHIAPSKIDREALMNNCSLPLGSKFDTLLPGHPLLLTSPFISAQTSTAAFNDIGITEWNVYNDGRFIIHGVKDFFDPSFQILRFPFYDENGNNTEFLNSPFTVADCHNRYRDWNPYCKHQPLPYIYKCYCTS